MQLFANNAKTLLASPVAALDATVTVVDGSVFPSPTGGDFFKLTLATGYPETAWEILDCTARTANVLTVTRAQEGTSAGIWGVGDRAESRLTAGDVIGKENSTTYGRSLLGAADANAAGVLIDPHFAAGILTAPSYTNNGDGTVTIGAGVYTLYPESAGLGFPKKYSLSGATFTLTDNSDNYIVADYNAGTPVVKVITDVSLITERMVIPIVSAYRHGTTITHRTWDNIASALPNKLHQRLVKTQRYARESGLALSESTGKRVIISEGVIWQGGAATTLAAFDSTTDALKLYSHVAGVWTETTLTAYSSTQYDPGTNVASTSNNKYVVNFVYRAVDADQKIAYITLGQGDYTFSEALAALPYAAPSEVALTAVLVGRIVVIKSGTTANQIDSAFAPAFVASPTIIHNETTSKQGGTTDQYYHLTQAQNNSVGSITSLTAGRVTYAASSGLLTDSANLTYVSGTGLTIADSTDSTSPTSSASIKTAGGLSVAKAINALSATAETISVKAGSYTTSFIAGTQSANLSYTLPTALPTLVDGKLKSTPAGVMSWDNSIEASWLGAQFSLVRKPATLQPPSVTAATINDAGFLIGNASSTTGYIRRTAATTTDWGGTFPIYTKPRTNLFSYSQDVTNASWNKSISGTGVLPVATGDTASAPDATTTADRLQIDRGAGVSGSDFSVVTKTATCAVGDPITMSVYLKSNTGSSQNVMIFWSYIGGALSNVVVVTTAWQRFTYSGFASTTTPTLQIGARGPYGDAVEDLLVWGAQCERGTTATKYIPTTTAAVTATPDFTTVDFQPVIDFAPIPASSLPVGRLWNTWEPARTPYDTARTNLAKYSRDFSNAAWAKAGTAAVVADSVAGPDGTTTADTINMPANADTVIQSVTTAVAIGQTHTFSLWVKGTAAQTLRLVIDADGTYESNTALHTLTGNWQLVSVSKTWTATHSAISIHLEKQASSTATSVYASDAQLEINPTATDRIPTAATAVTVPAEFDQNPTIYKTTTAGVKTKLALATDYTLGANGQINLAVAPASGDTISWLGGSSTYTPGLTCIVPSSAIGTWASQDNKLATWNGTAWTFVTPATNRKVYSYDQGVHYYYTGSAWAVDYVFGTLTDNTTFEADGTMVANGAATTFDDLTGEAVNLQQSGSGVSNNAPESTVDFLVTSNLSDYIYTSVQIPHKWKVGSVIYPHIHFFQTTSAMPNLLLQYRWQKQDGSAKVTSWTSLICNTAVRTYTSGTITQIARTAAGITPPSGSGVSDIVQFRVLRDNANTSTLFTGADPVAATVAIESYDIHIESDTLGSRSEYTK